jgi:multidrug resistance efflux pump
MINKFHTALWVATLLLILTACGVQNQSLPTAETPDLESIDSSAAVIAEGHLVPARDATLIFQNVGTVIEVPVQIGDKVKEGDVLARLGGQSDAAYAAAQLELVNAQQALDDLLDSTDMTLAEAVIDLKEAQEEYDEADDYLRYLQNEQKVPQTETRMFLIQTRKGYEYRYKTKNFKGPAPEDWIIEAENDLALKKAALDEAQRVHDRVKDGPDTDQLALLEARLNAAQASVAVFTLTAPFDGEVMDVNVAVGEQVGPETWAVKLADTSAWYVETSDLTELEIVDIAEGQPVIILPDALPEAEMTGVVETISRAFTNQGGDILYEVRIKADKIDSRLQWGMTVEVAFQTLEE